MASIIGKHLVNIDFGFFIFFVELLSYAPEYKKRGNPSTLFWVSPFFIVTWIYLKLKLFSLPNQARYQAALLPDVIHAFGILAWYLFFIKYKIWFEMSRTSNEQEMIGKCIF